MLSLVSHKLSIIKYVVLKKIFFSFSGLTVSFGLRLDSDSNDYFGLKTPVIGPVVKSSQVTFIYIALLTIQIVTKHCTI